MPCSDVVGSNVVLRFPSMSADTNTQVKKARSLSANVRGGATWNMASTMLLRLSSIGVTAIVARVLNAHDFGVFAVATAALTIVTAFGEFGVTSCLARADLEVDDLAPTLWSVALGSSLLMASVLYLFAEPIATGLGSRDAAGPVRVMSLVMVLWGVCAVPSAQCMREFKQSKIFLANVLGFIPATLVLLILATHGSGAMAFAWSRVVGQSVWCVVILFAAPRLYLPRMRRSALAILYRFGLPLACANCVGYVLQNVDYVLIGRLMGPVPLGTYVVAFNAASWSSSLLAGVLGMVAMPAFSRVKHDTARLMSGIARAVRAVMLIATPMCTLVMVLARPLVLTLYGDKWGPAASVLSILSIYGLISIVCLLFSSMLAALGRSKSVLGIQVLWLVALIPAMAIGVHRDGIIGAAIAHVVIIGPLVLPCYLVALTRATGVRIGVLVKAALPPLVIAAAAAFFAWLAAARFDRPPLELIAGSVVGSLFYLIFTAPQLLHLAGPRCEMLPPVRRVFRFYDNVSRMIGIPTDPRPQHAMRRSKK
jgi:lipopolysaccharide exporter